MGVNFVSAVRCRNLESFTIREQTYDVSGERFLMVEEIEDRQSQEVVIVLNWSEELKRLLPSKN